jgi:hypothetical protein
MREAASSIDAPIARFSRDVINRKATNIESSSSVIDKLIINREIVIMGLFALIRRHNHRILYDIGRCGFADSGTRILCLTTGTLDIISASCILYQHYT